MVREWDLSLGGGFREDRESLHHPAHQPHTTAPVQHEWLVRDKDNCLRKGDEFPRVTLFYPQTKTYISSPANKATMSFFQNSDGGERPITRAPLPPAGHLLGMAVVAEEQQGDRSGLQRNFS